MMLFWCSWFTYRFIKLDFVTVGKFALISSVVDCVSVNPSARFDKVLHDAQKVCALTIVGTVLKLPIEHVAFKLAVGHLKKKHG